MIIEKRFSIDEINQHVMLNLQETLAEFSNNVENKERKLPLEYKILKMEVQNSKNDALIKLSATKDNEGLLMFISVNVVKI